VDINLPELLLRVRAGETGEDAKNKRQAEGIGIPATLKLSLKAFRLAAGTPSLFSIGQRLGGLLSRVYSPRKKYMHLPAWTGWGYSKDFPRLETLPFRVRWKKIKQEVKHADRVIRQPVKPGIPEPLIAQSLAIQFTDELAAIGVKAYRLPEKEVKARLAELLQERGIERVCVDDIGKKYVTGIPSVRDPDPSIRVGVTGALLGIAESGSLVLVGGEGRPLTASLLPDIHIAILRESDLVPTLSDVLSKPEIRTAPAAVLITGPSRTGDIEMTLTIGVHGPKEVHVFLIEDFE
jgi:L-lactate dehydrogenase complex protein LldG